MLVLTQKFIRICTVADSLKKEYRKIKTLLFACVYVIKNTDETM